jgi:hypothetical protein
MSNDDSERLARMESLLTKNSEQLVANSGQIVQINEQLGANSGQITTINEQLAWMISWLDKKLEAIDQRFASSDQRFEALERNLDLKHEEMRSDFRAFREMQWAQAGRAEALEVRVESLGSGR